MGLSKQPVQFLKRTDYTRVLLFEEFRIHVQPTFLKHFLDIPIKIHPDFVLYFVAICSIANMLNCFHIFLQIRKRQIPLLRAGFVLACTELRDDSISIISKYRL
jgi:hypothetical protein